MDESEIVAGLAAAVVAVVVVVAAAVVVIILMKGVYKEAPVYTLWDDVYFRCGWCCCYCCGFCCCCCH